ncbi:MAG TPA: hypothetical protein VLB49_03720 [Gemmatimonadales bacterium]|nr:hypothetical protein [Gemmatimonadales bacterium]
MRFVLLISVAIVASACPPGGTQSGAATPTPSPIASLSAVPPPRVVAVEVVPHTVFVQPSGTPEGATFEIEARLWAATSWGQEIIPPSSGIVLTWETDQDELPSDQRWVRVEPMNGQTARVTVRGTFSSVPVKAVISAVADGVASNPSARVIVVSDPASSGEDRVINELHAENNPPAVALVTGMRMLGEEVGCSYYDVFPFVRSVLLGNLVANCPSGESSVGRNTAVFAPDQAMSLETADWTSAANTVDHKGLQRPEHALPIAVWIAVDGRDLDPSTDAALTQLRQDVTSQAVDDIREANTILTAGRVGVTASLASGYPKVLSSPASLAALGTDCWAADEFANAGGADAPEPGKLNVYYVNSLGGFGRGLTCTPHQQRDEPVVYVAWNSHSTTTLAHELGHSLGLQFPHDGHTDKLKGFDLTNFMAAFLDDKARANARDNVTLGQAFRMNVDAASWLNLDASGPIREAAAPRLACQCDPYTPKPCPGLAVDVAPVEADGATIEPWQCADMFLLGKTDASHDGVALLSGHRWRDKPGVCTKDAEGQAYHWYATPQLRLLFENFTSPGGCPSWLAVFFRNHGMMYRELGDGQSIQLSDGLDAELEWQDAPPPPFDVPVSVWTSAGASDLQGLATADVSTALGTFQGDNRTGIRLASVVRPVAISGAGTCALTPSTMNEINVYYLAAGDPLLGRAANRDGSWCREGSTDYIIIATGLLYSNTALAHHLGHSLGLADVTSTSGFSSWNVMWAQGTGARTAFSLGQVFRMNVGRGSWLNVSPKSPRQDDLRLDCDAGTATEADKCPGITAKVP